MLSSILCDKTVTYGENLSVILSSLLFDKTTHMEKTSVTLNILLCDKTVTSNITKRIMLSSILCNKISSSVDSIHVTKFSPKQ